MSSTNPTTRRTRGGWVPAGTSAARRTAHGSRTTAKGQRTREELVAAARRVFERDGYSGARVADITAEAGVAHGSFYTYFASRQDVFVAVMREVGEQFRVAVAVPPGEPRTGMYAALDRANRRYLEAYRANSVIWALAEQVATMDEEIHRIRLRGRIEHVERVSKKLSGGRPISTVATRSPLGQTLTSPNVFLVSSMTAS